MAPSDSSFHSLIVLSEVVLLNNLLKNTAFYREVVLKEKIESKSFLENLTGPYYHAALCTCSVRECACVFMHKQSTTRYERLKKLFFHWVWAENKAY
jgi:hypothetical protein